ncbi:MAG: hypothetical protein ABJC63_07430 [Gemmatimonadales bacterium]
MTIYTEQASGPPGTLYTSSGTVVNANLGGTLHIGSSRTRSPPRRRSDPDRVADRAMWSPTLDVEYFLESRTFARDADLHQ